jgi:hypothetical protein
MAISHTLRSLELYDILANLIPGGVLLISIAVVFQVESYINFSNNSLAAATFLIAAFVLGHIIQAVASYIDGQPTLFGDVIRYTRGENIDHPPLRITVVEKSVWPIMKKKFNLSDDFDDYGALFRLLLSHIETTPTVRALRFQSLHSFHRSMWAVGYITAILSILGWGLKWQTVVDVRSCWILLASFVASIVTIIVFKSRKEKMNERFIQYAMVDLYISHMNETRGRDIQISS